MSVPPYNVNVYRDNKWIEIISSDLVPGDLVSIGQFPSLALPLPWIVD
jgi:magnesium-transporting ATPase (P-type)